MSEKSEEYLKSIDLSLADMRSTLRTIAMSLVIISAAALFTALVVGFGSK